MRISLFNHRDDNIPKPWSGGWDDFCAHVIGEKHHEFKGDKKKSPSFSPAEYSSGALRGKANVTQLWLAVLDYDGVSNERLASLVSELQGNRFLLYTSYSHTDGPSARVRLVLDVDRPVPAKDWPRFWAAVATKLQGDDPTQPDPQCKDTSRLYYLPYTPNPADAIIDVYEGAPLCVDEVLGTSDSAASITSVASTRSQTISLDDLKTYAKRLSNRSNPSDVNMGRWLTKIAKREEYALPGSRHNTSLTITAHLERAFPDVPVDELARLFAGSLHHMRERDREFDPVVETIDITNSLQGARERRLTETAKRAEWADRTTQGEIKAAFRSDRIVPYTEEEIRGFAAAAGVSLEAFQKRWIVTHGQACHIFVDGEYRPPVPVSGLLTSARRDLAPASSVGVRLDKPGINGGPWLRKTREELFSDYGTEARAGLVTYLAKHSFYESVTQTINEAVCPPREIEPVYSETINGWLQILGGEHYHALQLWLKLVWDLSEPLAALYLEGAPGAGKSLFAAGVSRIWGTSGPTSAVSATGSFKSALLQNPVVFADEHLPDAWQFRSGLARFREFVAARERGLDRKYLPQVPLIGCMRIILAANNQDLLRSGEILTENDRQAIVDRLFHLHVTTEAANYLNALGSKRVAQFVEADELAAHAAWLRDNYEMVRQGRFGVAPVKTALHETMKHSQPIIAAVGEWLIGYLLDPSRYANNNQKRKHYVKVDPEGHYLVNLNAMRSQDAWTQYVSNPREVPSAYHLGRALGELAPERLRSTENNYRVVDIEGLITLAEQTQIATRKEIFDGMAKSAAQDKIRSN